MIKCKICDTEFKALKENKYIAKDTNILTREETYWDCFDCPRCGCQVIRYKRLQKVGGSNE